MELRQLKTFRTVATLRSFHQAANVLHYAQSTVSEQIRTLEEDLNVSLFIRSGKQIMLTEAGELLLQYAQQILELEDEIKTEVTKLNEPQGSLTIRIPETMSIYYVPPLIKQFHQQFPKIRLNFNGCSYYSLPKELQSGITNLAFLINDTYQSAQIETETLFSVPLALVVHPEHRLARQKKIATHDLKHELIFLPKADCSYRMMFEKTLAAEKIEPVVVMDVNSISAIKQYLLTGIGLTIIPRIAVQEDISAGRLIVLPWKNPCLNAKLLMMWHKNSWHSPILQAFMDMTREMFRGSIS